MNSSSARDFLLANRRSNPPLPGRLGQAADSRLCRGGPAARRENRGHDSCGQGGGHRGRCGGRGEGVGPGGAGALWCLIRRGRVMCLLNPATTSENRRLILIRPAGVGIGDGGGSRCAVPVGGRRDTPASETPARPGPALRPRSPSASARHELPSPALGKLRPARAPAYRPRQQNESPGRPADSLPGESPPLRSAPPSHSGGMTGRVGTPSRPVGAAYRLRHTSSMRRARVRHRSTLEAAPQPSSGTDR